MEAAAKKGSLLHLSLGGRVVRRAIPHVRGLGVQHGGGGRVLNWGLEDAGDTGGWGEGVEEMGEGLMNGKFPAVLGVWMK